MENKVLEYLKESFLKDYLENDDITDISFNGESLFYVSNKKGRKKADLIVEENAVKGFLRQLSNLTNQQFSYMRPFLDITVDRYRINAVHSSINRSDSNEKFSFSIRIASNSLRVLEDKNFMPKEVEQLLNVIINSKLSIIIGGLTGCGKTEFQRYLFTLMSPNQRVIIIDNVDELFNVKNPNLDLTYWQNDFRNQNASLSQLIKVGLRNNPDWLIIAEARGEETKDILLSATSGLPIITTLHALDIFTMPSRILSLVMKNSSDNKDFVYQEICMHFPLYIYLKKSVEKDGTIKRYLSSIMEVKKDGTTNLLYERIGNKHYFHKLTNEGVKLLDSLYITKEFKKVFIESDE